jgi:NAD(P)-dependent dehydrogenase (short-subunit alcohol dehydrogenase family)
VLVTGAASGLGASLAARLRGRGAAVLATDARADDGWDGDATDVVRRLDVTSDDDWAAAAAWVQRSWGRLDVLVNNAGVAGGGRLDRTTLEDWRWIFDVNLYGAVRGIRTFTPVFKQQGSGRVVNVASLAALVHPAGMGSYNAVKAALLALTETAGHELAAHGVIVHAVCPSYFRTNLMDSMRGTDEAVGRVMAELVTSAPLGADDVAEAVLAGIDAGEQLILPDPAARAAYDLKTTDRATYDEVMRAQARKLDAVARTVKGGDQ